MRKGNNVYVELIDNHLSFIKNLATEDKIKLEKKEMTIKFDLVPYYKKETKNESRNLDMKIQVDENTVIEKLYSFNSRAEGETNLNSTCNNRNAFEKVARKLDLPFQKKDNIEKLTSKIIERTIGFRLRSQAIQGTEV